MFVVLQSSDMDALQDFAELDVLEDAGGDRVRLPRRVVKDRSDYFLSLTEEEFTTRFRLSKESARDLLTRLHLPEANDLRGKCELLSLYWFGHLVLVFLVLVYFRQYSYTSIQ